jgi:transposase
MPFSYMLLSGLYLFLLLSSTFRRTADTFWSCSSRPLAASHIFTHLAHDNNMPRLSADAKHAILLEYIPHSTTHSFAALALRHSIAGGKQVVQKWHAQWNRSAASLKEKPRSGRPRILSRADVSRHVRAPILAANRAHRAVSYADLLPEVKRKTGKEISLRTLQRTGKEELGVKSKRTKKRTADESKCNAAGERRSARVCAEHTS